MVGFWVTPGTGNPGPEVSWASGSHWVGVSATLGNPASGVSLAPGPGVPGVPGNREVPERFPPTFSRAARSPR